MNNEGISGDMDQRPRNTFTEVARLIIGLRALPTIWAVVRLWKYVWWLGIHFDEGSSRVGLEQRRSIARLSAVSLLDKALRDIADALQLTGKVDVERVLRAAQVAVVDGRNVVAPSGRRRALQEPMRSPALGVYIPVDVVRTRRPDKIRLRFPATCRRCGESIPVGTEAQWRRGTGAMHLSCEWFNEAEFASLPRW